MLLIILGHFILKQKKNGKKQVKSFGYISINKKIAIKLKFCTKKYLKICLLNLFTSIMSFYTINMKSIKITLLGEPKSTSHIYKYVCRGGFPSGYMSAQGKALKEDYAWQAKTQYKKVPLEGNLKVESIIYFGTKRKCDLDNFNKLTFDSLSSIVWKDDSQIVELLLKKKYDKENPRIELTIEEL